MAILDKEGQPRFTRRRGLQIAAAVTASAVGSSLARRAEATGGEPVYESFALSDGGVHFTVPEIDEYDYPQGYTVRDPFLASFNSFGAERMLGRPTSRPWINEDGTHLQAFQNIILQLNLDPVGNVVNDGAADAMDQLSRLDRDSWLANNFNIPPVNWSAFEGKPAEQTEAERFAMFDRLPAVKAFVLSNPLWRALFGLPRSFDTNILRTSKTVLRVNPQNGEVRLDPISEIIKQKTDGAIIDRFALVLEMSERWWERRSHEKKLIIEDRSLDQVLSSLQGQGSPLWVQEVSRMIIDLKEVSPEDYQRVAVYARIIREGPMSARPWIQTMDLDPIAEPLVYKPEFRQDPFRFFQGAIVHEATHLEEYANGAKENGKYGELKASLRALNFHLRVGTVKTFPKLIKILQESIDSIDDPAFHWWPKRENIGNPDYQPSKSEGG